MHYYVGFSHAEEEILARAEGEGSGTDWLFLRVAVSPEGTLGLSPAGRAAYDRWVETHSPESVCMMVPRREVADAR